MRIGSLLLAVVGIAVAGGSVFVAREYVDGQADTASNAAAPAVVNVIVASAEIPFGQAIEQHMLTSIKWPVESVPPGVFTDYEALIGTGDVQARRAKTKFSQGELILTNKVSEPGEKVTIVQSLGKNTRAMAIKVSAETAVGGFVTPGDTVDVVLTQGREADLRAVTILQNIRVIGVDQDADDENDQSSIARTVTVEVSPEEGQKLALAQKAGTLSLSLRTLDSVEDAPLDSIKLSDLLREVSPVEDEKKAITVRVRRGTDTAQDVDIN